jgi:Fe-S-cluster-containing dehydrogenase component
MKVVFLSKNCRRFSHNDEAPAEGDQPVMVVDLDRCIACGACKLACQLEKRDRVAMQPGSIAVPRPVGSTEPLQVNLPLACRHCDTPCAYHDHHSFWITCPVHVLKHNQICDACESRLKKGYMPACATRCSMKCIYVCRPEDLKFPLGERRLRGFGDMDLNEAV